jgi:LmbE family N-acetylglucosaminyl deacetylase
MHASEGNVHNTGRKRRSSKWKMEDGTLTDIGRENGQRGSAGPAKAKVAVVVAHPDDETLWTGGTILAHPEWDCFVATLCRASDTDRAPRFFRALESLGSRGAMGDLDDGPEQTPLPGGEVRSTILSLLPDTSFDLILTHGLRGEYTRHRRHEEVSRAVLELWQAGELQTRELWQFAYEDGGGEYLPQATPGADRMENLPEDIRRTKHRIITKIYGFGPESFEAQAAPEVEAFSCYSSPEDVRLTSGKRRIVP